MAIGLPNGAYTMDMEKGAATLGKDLQLSNVLYMPNLKCNLVSISKLCKKLNCIVTYFDEFCEI